MSGSSSRSSALSLQKDQRIKFRAEKKPYRVRCSSSRFAVCTKPFNLKHTVMYTIVDLVEDVRGTENLIFCMGFESDDKCQEALARLENGETEVSHRNYVPLDIEAIL